MNDLDQFTKEQEQRDRWAIKREAKKQKRQDRLDLINAGAYDNGMDTFYDEYGEPREGVEIPKWAKALHKAHSSGNVGMRVYNRFQRRRINYPKPKPQKPKRTDTMKALLLKHGIEVEAGEPIPDYDGFTFLQGGRIRTDEDEIMSVYKFIKEYL